MKKLKFTLNNQEIGTVKLPIHLYHLSKVMDIVTTNADKIEYYLDFENAYNYLTDEYRKIAETQFGGKYFVIGLLNGDDEYEMVDMEVRK